MFSFFSQNIKVLRCSDIPQRSNREQEIEMYPQKSRSTPNTSLKKIISRYGVELHGITDNLPILEEDIDRLLMPVILEIIKTVHLLPASESHHHFGPGGLLLHSLESAGAAIRFAEQTLFDSDLSPAERYKNAPRWIVASVLMLLIHDLGKLCDMTITDNAGRIWNPNTVNLYSWLDEGGAESYVVNWQPNRIHKAHERRTLRFAYRGVLTNELVTYLTFNGTGKILAAIEDAILFGEGTLASVLQKADSYSVAKDMERHKHIAVDAMYGLSPLTMPLLASMRENLQSGAWQVNVEGGYVFVTSEGVLLRTSTQMGKEIRDIAVSRGHQGIPLDIAAQMRILAQGGFIETTEKGEFSIFSVKVLDQTLVCLRFLMPEELFPQGLPAEIPATLSRMETVRGPQEEKEETPSIHTELTTTQATDYAGLFKETLTRKESSSNTCSLSPTEISEVLETALGKDEAKNFAKRLFADTLNQLRCGSGPLISDRKDSTTSISCSSWLVEKVATNHGITSAMLEALFHALRSSEQFNFDAENHKFEVIL